jgi:ABC-type glycerol-3-phosphate transport system substrate-binding protein
MKKWILWLMVLIISVSFVTVMVSAAESEKKFVFWTWGDPGNFEKGWEVFVKENPQYKDIEFELFKPARAETITEYLKLLMASYAAGTGLPDCMELPSMYMPILASEGVLMDLTEKVNPYLNDLPKGIVDGVSYNDKVWALPWRANISEMYYRKDVFDLAGVDFESIETWDDFINAGKKVTKVLGGEERYMVNVGATTIDFDIKIFPFFSYYGIGIFDPDTGDTIIDTDPRAQEAIALAYKFVKEGIAYRADDWSASWFSDLKEGRIASVLAANWFPEVLMSSIPETEGLWRVALPPAFTEGGPRYGTQAGSANLAGISKTEIPDVVW